MLIGKYILVFSLELTLVSVDKRAIKLLLLLDSFKENTISLENEFLEASKAVIQQLLKPLNLLLIQY